MSDDVDEAPVVKLPAPQQILHVARKLREITPVQRREPFEQILSVRTATAIAGCLEELVRLTTTTRRQREQALEDRVDALAILATSRRIPLEAVRAALRRAEGGGGVGIPVEEIRRALDATEPR